MITGKFRGLHNGGWKKGFLSYNFKTNEHEIVNSQGAWPVIEESIGQSTGRQSISGIDAYDGDKVKSKNYDGVGTICWHGNGWAVQVEGDSLLYSLNYPFEIHPELLQDTE